MPRLAKFFPYVRHSLRVLIAAGAAWSIATLLGLPQAQWAAISALVVMQDTAGATARAGRDRILATAFGALAGAVSGFAHAQGWPDIVAWIAALLPAVILASLKREYRTAPIAALIVMSSVSTHVSPLGVALLRMLEISLGASVGVAVSRWLLPTPSRERLRQHAVELFVDLADFAGEIGQGGMAENEARSTRIRTSLWEIGGVARGAKHEREDSRIAAQAYAKNIRRVNEDLVFLARVAGQAGRVAEMAPALAALGPALKHAVRDARAALGGGPALQPLDVEALVPPIGKGGRAAEIWAALRFGLRSLNRQLESLVGQPPEPAEGDASRRSAGAAGAKADEQAAGPSANEATQ